MMDIYRIPALEPELEGIVTLLEGEYRDRVMDLWKGIEEKFGIASSYAAPLPHFSYQVADTYQRKGLESALSKLAGEHSTFTVRTAGLGVFTGSDASAPDARFQLGT